MTNIGTYKHVVFTDHENISDIKHITGTMLISQVSGTQSLDTPSLVSTRLPYLCPPCCKNVNEMMEKCEYKNK